MNQEIVKTLMVMAELYDKQFSEAAAKLLVSDLSAYEDRLVLESLTQCRKELSRFPTLSDIISRINDGRPGPEEAWAMVPKSEDDSVCWTTEMATAFGSCRDLLRLDMVAARVAFKERYEKELRASRASGKRVHWELSFGFDKHHRETVVREAVRLGRLPAKKFQHMLPPPTNTIPENVKMIEGLTKNLFSMKP